MLGLWGQLRALPLEPTVSGGVSTSLAFMRNWSVKEVLKAASWRSNIVFANFYLKDVMFVFDNCFSLGPLVTAGQVLNASSRV